MDNGRVRLVSLLPSATDIIAVAGALDLLVGRSHECNWPKSVERLPILTGAVNQFVDSKQMDDVVTASLDRGEGLYFLEQELLRELKPDVIVTQDLCNVCSVDLQLVQKTVNQLSIKPTIVTLNPQKLSDVLKDILKVGTAVGCQQQSEATVTTLKQRVSKAQDIAKAASEGCNPIKVAFVEWLDPLFVGGHWTPEMIKMAGGTHPLNMPIGDGGAGPSIRIPNEALVEADCDWIIVCPCGFSIEDTKKEEDLLSSKPWWQSLRAVREGKVAIVDGNQMFARPGPRLVDALEFLVGLLHNKHSLIPADFPWTWWDTKKAATMSKSSVEAPSASKISAVYNCHSGTDNRTGTAEASSNKTAHEPAVAGINPSADDTGNDAGSNGIPDITTIAHQDGTSSCSASSRAESEHAPEQSRSAQTSQDSKAAQQTNSSETAQQDGTAQDGNAAQQSDAGQATQQSRNSKAAQSSEGSQAARQAGHRQWGAAPFLSTEIEEAHAAAIEAGQPTYTDPATGYKVITEQNLRQQSVCCANRCRHCPFGHYKVPASRGPRINNITRPTVLKINRKEPVVGSTSLSLWSATDTKCSAPASLAGAEGETEQWLDSTSDASPSTISKRNSGTPALSMCTKADQAATSKTVYVAVFEQGSGQLCGSTSLTLHDAMDACLQAGQVLVAVPEIHHQPQLSEAEATYVLSVAQNVLS